MKDTQIKVLVVFGTRPEAIKLAPVIAELARRIEVQPSTCVTAQHRQMLDQALNVFDIQPSYDLDLMTESQSPTQVGAAVLSQIDTVLASERPDWVLVQGDTTTVATATLAAYYRRVRVAHVEAGLRTGDKWQPFPEEVNRKVAGAIADRHFCPTPVAKHNLLREGVPEEDIVITGNTAIDALHRIIDRPQPDGVRSLIGGASSSRTQDGQRLILVTAHRRETFGGPLENICTAIRQVATSRRDIRVVFPVHLNPTVRRPVSAILDGLDSVCLIDPLDYTSLVHLMNASHLILTDSGGIQEEAPALGKPVLVMREVTERPEGVEAGVAKLVGTNADRIIYEAQRLLEDSDEYGRMARAINPYGDGQASRRIVQSLLGEPTDEFALRPS